MPKTKTYLPFPIFVISAVLVGLSAWYTIKTYGPVAEPIGINEVTSTGTVSLSLTPSTITILPNTDTLITMNVNSGTDKLSTVKFELTYDATKLTVSSPTVGTWITKQLTPITVANGKITGELGALPDLTAGATTHPEFNRTGSGNLLTFKVKGTTAGTYPINFSAVPTESWTVTGTTANSTNRLRSVSGTTITISNPALVTDIVGTDHKVDKYDYVELINQYGKLPAGTADFNRSGSVGGDDYSTLIADYGKTW